MKQTINVTRSSMPGFEEYCEEIRGMWDSHWLTNMGVKHHELQAKLTQYLGVDRLELVTNGHMAIELSLEALGLTGEVITTPFTFASTTHAIVRCGLEPVFCDIDPKNFTIDVNQIERHITEKTTAILPVHVYGNVCNVEVIDEFARKYNLKVIYDAAHAFGVRYKGEGIGRFGNASCFSFHATKVFNTLEGGAVSYGEAGFGERLSKLKNFGITGPETVEMVGGNAKLDEFRAAMGLCNLRHVNSEIAKRRLVAERYRERLADNPWLQLNLVQREVISNYAYFPIVIHENPLGVDREMVMRRLASNEVYARKYFYPLTSEFSCYKGQFDSEKTPVAKEISRKILCLPLYADLSLEDVDYICNIILSCKK